MTAKTTTTDGDKAWFGQPPGLTILFLTEMWEVFSFVGMRTLLVYYMTKQLLMAQQQASVVYGLYTGFVYLTPLFGGMIADRWLGRRRAVIVGGSIMALGHFMMTFEGLFYPALATVAFGNGLFLPSLPSQIAALYRPDDPRRASAYSVYYMGKNLGAFLAPLICGTIGELVGWHWGFGAAGIGMVLGLIVYTVGGRHLPPEPKTEPKTSTRAAPIGAGAMGRIAVLAGVALSVVIFRSAYEQKGNTVALWLDQAVNRALPGGGLIPMTWFQSLNPLLVFVLTPVLIAWWTRMARNGREPTPLAKMSAGAGLVSCAYLLLCLVSLTTLDGARVHWMWPMLFFTLLTIGELFILPIGLGLFGRLAPPAIVATVIACWYLTSFGGNLLAGVIGSFWSRSDPSSFFGLAAVLAGISALLLLALERPARSLETARTPGSPDISLTVEGRVP